MPIRHRILLFCAVFSAVAFAMLLSRPGPAASTPSIEPGTAPLPAAYIPGSGLTIVTTDTITIPTYPYAAYLYTDTNPIYNIPYRWLHWGQYEGSHPQPVDKTYTRLTLENDWLRVSLLPELGGRVYEMIFKPTGNNELYRNPVIKPTHWGPTEQGWWLAAGGLEWGLPVEEHGYESAIPWLYEVITGTDGITITLRDSLQPDRLRAAIAVFLPNDRAVLLIRPRLENDRDTPLDFKWWDNALLAPGPGNSIGKQGSNPNGTDLQFIFPESQVTVHSSGDSSLPSAGQAMTWPIYKNRDMSRVQNWNQWLGFFARPAASADWVSVLDQAHQEGIVRIFPRAIAQGSKGFAMGWRHPIGADEWTDDNSYYAELHGGLAPTFWDTVSIGAHQAIQWEETWYPVTSLSQFSSVTNEAAFFAEHTGTDANGRLDVTAYATRPRAQARLAAYWRGRCDVILEATSTLLTPGTVLTFSHDVQVPFADLGVTFTASDELLAQYNLADDGQPPDVHVGGLPAYVSGPDIPVDVRGTDPNCVRSFDVQVRDGWNGLWTPWLTATVAGTHFYSGQDGHTYYFRARARDLPGNQSAYTTNPFGDVFTSVLLTPAPVLDTSLKSVNSPLILEEPSAWTIDVWNTGNISTTATLTDTLPPFTTILANALWLNGDPAPQLYVDGQLRWSGVITENEHITITYHLSPTLPLTPGTILTNTALIAYGDSTLTRTAYTTQPYQTFLPVIMR